MLRNEIYDAKKSYFYGKHVRTLSSLSYNNLVCARRTAELSGEALQFLKDHGMLVCDLSPYDRQFFSDLSEGVDYPLAKEGGEIEDVDDSDIKIVFSKTGFVGDEEARWVPFVCTALGDLYLSGPPTLREKISVTNLFSFTDRSYLFDDNVVRVIDMWWDALRRERVFNNYGQLTHALQSLASESFVQLKNAIVSIVKDTRGKEVRLLKMARVLDKCLYHGNMNKPFSGKHRSVFEAVVAGDSYKHVLSSGVSVHELKANVDESYYDHEVELPELGLAQEFACTGFSSRINDYGCTEIPLVSGIVTAPVPRIEVVPVPQVWHLLSPGDRFVLLERLTREIRTVLTDSQVEKGISFEVNAFERHAYETASSYSVYQQWMNSAIATYKQRRDNIDILNVKYLFQGMTHDKAIAMAKLHENYAWNSPDYQQKLEMPFSSLEAIPANVPVPVEIPNDVLTLKLYSRPDGAWQEVTVQGVNMLARGNAVVAVLSLSDERYRGLFSRLVPSFSLFNWVHSPGVAVKGNYVLREFEGICSKECCVTLAPSNVAPDQVKELFKGTKYWVFTVQCTGKTCGSKRNDVAIGMKLPGGKLIVSYCRVWMHRRRTRVTQRYDNFSASDVPKVYRSSGDNFVARSDDLD